MLLFTGLPNEYITINYNRNKYILMGMICLRDIYCEDILNRRYPPLLTIEGFATSYFDASRIARMI